MSLILAIDQSTSATKAILFDAQGAVLDKASRNHTEFKPQMSQSKANQLHARWHTAVERVL